VIQEYDSLCDAILPSCSFAMHAQYAEYLSVHKVVFMADQIMIIPILGKLPFVGTPFITEDGCSGSDMSSNMTYKCLPSAIPDESQYGSSGLPVELLHP